MGSRHQRPRADADLEALEARMGHVFGDRALLEQALTHRSRSGRHNNERLEFLGDALLGYVVASELFRRHPGAAESALTLLRASLVRQGTLADVARSLDLGDWLRLGSGELKSGGYRRDSILSDAVEALIGAVLLDAGHEAAAALVTRLLGPRLIEARPDAIEKDPKTRLQEYLQGRARPLPEYEVLAVGGSEHDREFRVRVTLLDAAERAEGGGRSRRAAEQGAAEKLLAALLGHSGESS